MSRNHLYTKDGQEKMREINQNEVSDKEMKESHPLRVRGDRWDAIEKKAWELSGKAKRVIKPTDVADAALYKSIAGITLQDIEEAAKNR